MKYLIGIDCGTTMLKVNLYTDKGKFVSTFSCSNPLMQSERKKEIDMYQLWEKVLFLLKKITSVENVCPKDIIAIGVCGQGEGLWTLDKRGKPLGNAILWNDSRALDLITKLNKDRELIDEIKSISGSYLFPGATSVLLKYIKKNDTERYNNIGTIFFCKDYIRYCLTGDISSDYSDMSTSLLDLRTHELSSEILKLLDIEEVESCIAPVKKSYEKASGITKEVSKLTGIAEGTPVSIGMLDVISTLAGVGATESGDISVTLGTTCSCGVVRSDLKDFTNKPGYELHFIDDMYLEVMAAMSGVANLEWAIDKFYPTKRKKLSKRGKSIYKYINKKIEKTPPGAEGILYHPYISESGERMPFQNPNARAQFIGLSYYKSRGMILRAVMEGVALSIRDCLTAVYGESFNYDEDAVIYLAGGGSNNKLWSQIIADVCGRTVKVMEGGDFTCRGAAVLGLAGINGNLKDALDVMGTYPVKYEFKPNRELFGIYTDMYLLYKDIREQNYDYWSRIKKIRDQSKTFRR